MKRAAKVDAPALPWAGPALKSLQKRLLSWSQQTPRPMPWRSVPDAYRVWISEIMLQQTTVAAVIPYYERFLARFPDLQTLASASEQDVLAQWEGLGYYSRGRNLHRAAQVVMAEHGGEFPRDVTALNALPGIGRYTAGAIASFAFNLPAPILEANTQRVYARLAGYEGDPRSTAGQSHLWSIAEKLLPAKEAGAFNQGLIDLGALVCTPTGPLCSECPVQRHCRAFQAGRQEVIPPPKTRPAITEVHELAIAVRDRGRWLVRQRQAGERWAGMWDFPRVPLTDHSAAAQVTAGLRMLVETTGLQCRPIVSLPVFTHSVTRYRIRLHRMTAELMGGTWTSQEPVQWLSLTDLAGLPMPMAARKLVTDLQSEPWDPDASFSLTAGPRKRVVRRKTR